ncbi:Uncharacterized protein APZ42_028729 [Daphnia magna]|uniref:Uncharacterized protein n=1 Tax=Daphnia magna TaxID=35525 RepID=A0A164QA66_9CRUS|nr:Uncharacterized protein APZ42_028729 [Daphnia magna]
MTVPLLCHHRAKNAHLSTVLRYSLAKRFLKNYSHVIIQVNPHDRKLLIATT